MEEVSARDFGRLEAEVETLKRQITSMQEDIRTLLELANKSKGGFLFGMAIASTFGGVLTFIAQRLLK